VTATAARGIRVGEILNFRRATLWWHLLYLFARISYNAVVAIVNYSHSPLHLPSSLGACFPERGRRPCHTSNFLYGEGARSMYESLMHGHDCSRTRTGTALTMRA
jgi:hypothetical protein